MSKPVTALDVPFGQPRSVRERQAVNGQRVFERLGEGRYSFALCDVGIRFDADGVHQERYGLVGMLRVQCDLPGAKTYHGNLPAANLNFSNMRDRKERAQLLRFVSLRVTFARMMTNRPYWACFFVFLPTSIPTQDQYAALARFTFTSFA